MSLDWRVKRAADLRNEADRLEKESKRNLPKKWKVGQRVRFLRTKDWAWVAGCEATIVDLSKECKTTPAHEYQVFWTKLDGYDAEWWTTPDDVELVDTKGLHKPITG